MRQKLIISVLIASICFFPRWALDANAESMAARLEYQIKTAFLFNFAKYVDWPPNSFDKASDSFTIGILAAPKLVPTAKMLADKRVKGGRVKVFIFKSLEDVIPCHMLFVGMDSGEQLDAIIKKFKDVPVLTVSDAAGFANQGGVINFITVNNTIRFEINPKVAEEKKLRISSRLLSLARIVSDSQSTGTEK